MSTVLVFLPQPQVMISTLLQLLYSRQKCGCFLAGESDPIKKSPEEDPWVRSGTQVSEGSGRLLVVATGATSPKQVTAAGWTL